MVKVVPARVLLTLAVVAAASALDVEPAKLATADAAPLDPGALELDLGLDWTRASDAFAADGHRGDRGGRFDARDLGLAVAYGVADGLDAGAGIGWSRVNDAASDPSRGNGHSDLALGAKWAFWSRSGDAGAVAVALLPQMVVPLGGCQDADAEIPTATRCWTAGAALATSGNLGRVALNADAGYVQALGSAGQREGYRGTVFADAAVGVQVRESIQPEIDLSWARDRVEAGDAPWALAVTAGVELGLPIGRLGLGVQRVVAGASTDAVTTAMALLAIAIE